MITPILQIAAAALGIFLTYYFRKTLRQWGQVAINWWEKRLEEEAVKRTEEEHKRRNDDISRGRDAEDQL